MAQQPRRNEARFYRYPLQRIVAIIDDDAGVDAALDDLPRAGVDVSRVTVLSGSEGARLLDAAGTSHGVRGRLLRLLQWGAYEADTLRAHERALNEGHHVIYVPVRSEEQRARVADILRSSRGHDLLYFRLWSIEEVQAY